VAKFPPPLPSLHRDFHSIPCALGPQEFHLKPFNRFTQCSRVKHDRQTDWHHATGSSVVIGYYIMHVVHSTRPKNKIKMLQMNRSVTVTDADADDGMLVSASLFCRVSSSIIWTHIAWLLSRFFTIAQLTTYFDVGRAEQQMIHDWIKGKLQVKLKHTLNIAPLNERHLRSAQDMARVVKGSHSIICHPHPHIYP